MEERLVDALVKANASFGVSLYQSYSFPYGWEEQSVWFREYAQHVPYIQPENAR